MYVFCCRRRRCQATIDMPGKGENLGRQSAEEVFAFVDAGYVVLEVVPAAKTIDMYVLEY
jgi:hypothetical protein